MALRIDTSFGVAGRQEVYAGGQSEHSFSLFIDLI